MNIVVTGVAGFIGANLAERLLREGHRVVGIDNLAYGLRSNVPEGVDFHELDIRGREMYPLFDGADAAFHLAAKNCIADCQADPVETADINVRGSVNVFEAARRAGGRNCREGVLFAALAGIHPFSRQKTKKIVNYQIRGYLVVVVLLAQCSRNRRVCLKRNISLNGLLRN